MNTAAKSFRVGPASMNIVIAVGEAVEITKTFSNGNIQVRAHGRYVATVPASWVR